MQCKCNAMQLKSGITFHKSSRRKILTENSKTNSIISKSNLKKIVHQTLLPPCLHKSNVVVLLRPPYRTNVIATSSPAYASFSCIFAIFFSYLLYQTNLQYTNLFLYFHFFTFFFTTSSPTGASLFLRLQLLLCDCNHCKYF